jgi:excisionase family DNA binding protein
MDAAPEDDWLTTGELAREAKKSIDTIRSWIDSGRLPAVRTGTGMRLARRSTLTAFLATLPRRRQRGQR